MKTALWISDIENAFYDMVKRDNELQEYFFSYYLQKLILLNHFYPHVEGVLPGFTDHGPKHIRRILSLYGKMLKNNILGLSESQDVVGGLELNYYEIYLLLCATIWHDVGNLLGRIEHNQKIEEIAKRLENRLQKNFFVDDDVKKYSLQIAKAHTGKDAVVVEISREDIDYKNEEINLRFLGAILRFADELDEGEVRVDGQYYESMKDRIEATQKIYWEAALCIKRITPKADDSNIEIRATIYQNDIFKLFLKNKDEKKTALIDELVFRIDKINQERIYYMKFLRKHVEYREIIFDLSIDSDAHVTLENFTFRFDNDNGYDSFWKNYPQLNPEKNVDGYTLQKGSEK